MQGARTVATGSFDAGRELVGDGLPREVARKLKPKVSAELARTCGQGRACSSQREQNVPDLKERGRWHIPGNGGIHSPRGTSEVNTSPRKALL